MVKQTARKNQRKPKALNRIIGTSNVEQDVSINMESRDFASTLGSSDNKSRELGCLVLMNLVTEQSSAAEGYVSDEKIMKLVGERIMDSSLRIRSMAIGILRAISGWAPSNVLGHLEQTNRLFTLLLTAMNEAFSVVSTASVMGGKDEHLNQSVNVLIQSFTTLVNAATQSDQITAMLCSNDPAHHAPLAVSPLLLAAKFAVPTTPVSVSFQLHLSAATLLATLLEDNSAAALTAKTTPGLVPSITAGITTVIDNLKTLLGGAQQASSVKHDSVVGNWEALGVELATSVYSILGGEGVTAEWIEVLRRAVSRDTMATIQSVIASDAAAGDNDNGGDEESSANNNNNNKGEEMTIEGDEGLMRGEKYTDGQHASRQKQDIVDSWARDLDSGRTALEAILTLLDEAESEESTSGSNRRNKKEASATAVAAKQTICSVGLAITVFSRLAKLADLPSVCANLRQKALFDEMQSLLAYATPLCHTAAVIGSSNPAVRSSVKKFSVISQVLSVALASTEVLIGIEQDELDNSVIPYISGAAIELIEAAFRAASELTSIALEDGLGQSIDAANSEEFQEFKSTALKLTSAALLLTSSPLPPQKWIDALTAHSATSAERVIESWKSSRAMAVSFSSLSAVMFGQDVLSQLAPVWVSALKAECELGVDKASALIISELCDGLFERFGDENNDGILKQAGLVPVLQTTAELSKAIVAAGKKKGFLMADDGVIRLKEEILPNLTEYIKYKKSHGL